MEILLIIFIGVALLLCIYYASYTNYYRKYVDQLEVQNGLLRDVYIETQQVVKELINGSKRKGNSHDKE